jgi:5-bromo-4-chloroindolyl phosphate hydrolysis protein
MAKVVKKPVLPIYAVGVVWLVFALFFSLHTMMDYILCVLASALVFAVASAICPAKSFEVPDKQEKQAEKQEPVKEKKPASTGNKEIDELIQERERALSEMRRLNDAIEDEKISAQIDHLELVTRKIIDRVVAEPKKLPQIRRFMNYYLPTTLKILNAYDRMDSAGIAGDNITTTKQKVENMMDTIVKAYDKQLDALYGEEALDISTDITVMENLLSQEGLAGLNINDTAASEEKKDGDGGITLQL